MVQYRQFKNISLFLSERSLSWNTKKKLAGVDTIIRMNILTTIITNILMKKSIADAATIIRTNILTIIMIIPTKKVVAVVGMNIRTNTMSIPTRMVTADAGIAIHTIIITNTADAAVTKKRNRHIITPMTKICCITKKICPTS